MQSFNYLSIMGVKCNVITNLFVGYRLLSAKMVVELEKSVVFVKKEKLGTVMEKLDYDSFWNGIDPVRHFYGVEVDDNLLNPCKVIRDEGLVDLKGSSGDASAEGKPGDGSQEVPSEGGTVEAGTIEEPVDVVGSQSNDPLVGVLEKVEGLPCTYCIFAVVCSQLLCFPVEACVPCLM